MDRKKFIENLKVTGEAPCFSTSLLMFIKTLQEKYPNLDIHLEKIERKNSTKKDDFISIKSKKSENPIHFKILAKSYDLSIYQSSPEYDTLNYRYDLYNTVYRDKIITQFIKERKHLQECFPTVVFNTKVRQKSKFSYEDKIIERMIKNEQIDEASRKSNHIRDVIAGRHVISSIDGNTDPEVLSKLCFEFEQELIKFRRQENSNDFDIVLRKDYISTPKENGYQSIHLINQDIQNPDCTYETQIRTFDMEEQSKHDEKIAHDSYKPRIIDQYAPLRVPIYTNIAPFLDEHGNPTAVTLPLEDSFYHFYGMHFSQYTDELNTIMPAINDIRNELYTKQPIKAKELV